MHEIIVCSILIFETLAVLVILTIMIREMTFKKREIKKYLKRKKKADKQRKKLKIYEYKKEE